MTALRPYRKVWQTFFNNKYYHHGIRGEKFRACGLLFQRVPSEGPQGFQPEALPEALLEEIVVIREVSR